MLNQNSVTVKGVPPTGTGTHRGCDQRKLRRLGAHHSPVVVVSEDGHVMSVRVILTHGVDISTDSMLIVTPYITK